MKNETILKLKELLDGHKEMVYVDYHDFEDLESVLSYQCKTKNGYEYYKNYTSKEEFIDGLIEASYDYNENFERIISELKDRLTNVNDDLYDETFDEDSEDDCYELSELVWNTVEVEFPVEEFLRQKINVNILTMFDNDLNSDFSENGWLTWLLQTQGMKLEDFPSLSKEASYRNLQKCEDDIHYYDPITDIASDKELNETHQKLEETVFGKSLITEIENLYIDSMRTFTVILKMTIADYFDLVSGTKAIKIDSNCVCGLFDTWQGGGSVFGIELEKPITIQPENIFNVLVEGNKGNSTYSVDNVYGLSSNCWKEDYELLQAEKKVMNILVNHQE